MITATLHTDDGTTAITSETWLGVIQDRGYTAFIFDCDGTLVESADVHFTSFFKAAAEQGHVLEREWYLARTGLDRISLFHEFAKSAVAFDIDDAVARSITLFIDISDRVTAIPEIESLVKTLGLTAPLAVGTNAEKHVAHASLQATGLLSHFDEIVAVTDGLAPKPSPEIFSRAADLLGAPRPRTLVIEDSVQGVAAARSAGMDVIEITSIN